ncbi:MAG: NrsF family protein [Pseudomonadota bacterium]
MKANTDDLIARLAGDLHQAPAAARIRGGRLAAAAVVIAASSLVLSGLLYGVRPDGPSSGWVGLTVWSALALAGLVPIVRSRAPDAAPPSILLVPGGAMLAILLAATLWASAKGAPAIRFDHVAHCLQTIGVLSLAPFICISAFIRRGAPASPAATGALAGLVAGAIGALAYSVSCPIHDPMTALSAHAAAVLVFALLGAVVGRRLYAW